MTKQTESKSNKIPIPSPNPAFWYYGHHIVKIWEQYLKSIANGNQTIKFGITNHNNNLEIKDSIFNGLTQNHEIALILQTSDTMSLYKNNKGQSLTLCGEIGNQEAFHNIEEAIQQIKTYNDSHIISGQITDHLIIFPYHKTGHWNLGNLALSFEDNKIVKANVRLIEPFGGAGYGYNYVINQIKSLDSFKILDLEITKTSINHIRQQAQHDGASCGPITAENGKEFIKSNQSTNIEDDFLAIEYTKGAENLRTRHIREINDESFTKYQSENIVASPKGDTPLQKAEQKQMKKKDSISRQEIDLKAMVDLKTKPQDEQEFVIRKVPSRVKKSIEDNVLIVCDTNNGIKTREEYNTLLDAIDILLIRQIIECISVIKNKSFDPYCLRSLENQTKMHPAYQGINEPDSVRRGFIENYMKIADFVDVMSERTGSIKNYFRHFPWQHLIKAGNFLKEKFEKYKIYSSEFNKDLDELNDRLEFMIQVFEIKNPKIREIFQANNLIPNNTNIEEYKKITKQYEVYRACLNKKLKFVSPGVDAQGLYNIRKITEPILDQEIKAKILGLISQCQEYHTDTDTSEGRSALIATTCMIGEAAKNISNQTKNNNPSVNFRALKDFRDFVGHCFDKSKQGFVMLNCISKNIIYKEQKSSNTLFQEIRNFLLNDFQNSISQMSISKNSLPYNEPSGLPFLLKISSQKKLTKLSSEEVNSILQIIGNAITKLYKDKDLKLNLMQKILSGELPIPVDLLSPKINFVISKLFCSIFGDKLQTKLYQAKSEINTLKDITKDINFLQGIEKKIFKIKIKDLKNPDTTQSTALQNFKQFIANHQHLENNVTYELTSSVNNGNMPYIKNQMAFLSYSLENISTKFDKSNYETLREKSKIPETHYYHLWNLIVIGQAIQNLIGKQAFLQYSESDLLIEFDFLKWVRNGLMHDGDISELGSVFAYFKNDMMHYNIKEHGARAYDSNEYLQSLLPKIKNTMNNIMNKKSNENFQDAYYKDLLTKELQRAFNVSGYEVEKLIMIGLGKKIEIFKPLEEKGLKRSEPRNELQKYHQLAQDILYNSRSIDLMKIYKKYQDLKDIAHKYSITLGNFFGKIVEYGFAYEDQSIDSGIFVTSKSDKNLALFKQSLHHLLDYRLKVVTESHLKEYKAQNIKLNDDKDQLLFNENNNVHKVLKGMSLHCAIRDNEDIEKIKNILETECKIDLIYEGYAPVHKIYHKMRRGASDKKEILSLLLSNKANPNIKDKHGNTLAHDASAEAHNTEVLKLLHEAKADFNIANSKGHTPLNWALQYNDTQLDVHDFLLKHSASQIEDRVIVNIKNEQLERLKKDLSQFNQACKIKILNTESKNHGLVGNVACEIGNLPIIEFLEQTGCNFNVSAKNGTTALEEACYAHNARNNSSTRITLITKLIDANKINITDTAMHNALYCNDLKILELLLEKKGNVNARGISDSFTLLLDLINLNGLAARDLQKIKLLLNHKADILLNEGYVGNSLHLAVERGHLPVVTLLLNHANTEGNLEALLQPSPQKCWVCGGLNASEIADKYNQNKIKKYLTEYLTRYYSDSTESDRGSIIENTSPVSPKH